MSKRILMIVLLVSAIALAGCAGLKIRSSNLMYEENPIKEIAVVAEARVEWPRMGDKEAVLGLTESKKSLEMLLPQTKDVFSKKGYNVTFCEPVGIAYYNPHYKENWVVETSEGNNDNGNESKKWQITNNDPAYEYPIVQDNYKLKKAIRNVFEGIELAIYEKRLDNFVPLKSDIEIINKVVGADAICFNRIYGQKYSTRRKAGDFALDVVVAGMFGVLYPTSQLTDMIGSHFTCVSTITGEVLWQHGIYTSGDPTNPSKTFVSKCLKPFPEINNPMDTKYKK